MDAVKHARHDHPKAVLYAAAAVIRVLAVLLFPGLPDLLALRAEIATPINSFKRCESPAPRP